MVLKILMKKRKRDTLTTLVLGRTSAHTLDLRVDEHGLWGSILINRNDQDAMNMYARVQRGDVSQCSFGFDILEESYEKPCGWLNALDDPKSQAVGSLMLHFPRLRRHGNRCTNRTA